MDFAQTMAAIQKATRGARERTGDTAIATRVSKGRLQLVRIIKHPNGKTCSEVPFSEYLPIPEAIRALEAL